MLHAINFSMGVMYNTLWEECRKMLHVINYLMEGMNTSVWEDCGKCYML